MERGEVCPPPDRNGLEEQNIKDKKTVSCPCGAVHGPFLSPKTRGAKIMSEQSGFPFGEVSDGAGLDIDAIFGGASGGSGSVNPFEAALAQQPTPIPQEAPQTIAPQPVPQAVQQPAPPVFQNVQPAPAPVAQSVVPAVQPPLDIDPLAAAMAEQEAKTEQKAAKSLFEKAPVFLYGSAREDIADPGMTFEELRIAKSEDFPELGEGKKVSWTVEYGKTVKAITDPKGTTIAAIKKEIELSKPFLDNLKKAKDKNPDCLVKPKVTAQSKGIAAYKGVFASLEEARASDKTICTIPCADGRVYELRKNELGEFIAPKDCVIDLESVRAGFTPALPLVPMELLAQIISFFRCYMKGVEQFEAMAHIFWDKQEEKFVAHIPKQRVTKAHIDVDLTQEDLPEDRYLHYIDIHSHNSMEAKFSPVDDEDEQATRIYIVVGRLDKFFPDITVRMSCGGTYLTLPPGCVLESFGAVFPAEWRNQVQPLHREALPLLHPRAERLRYRRIDS